MRIALVQLAAGTDPAENMAAVRRLTKGVEADLVVLPEAVMHDFGPVGLPLGPVAQPLDGPFVGLLAEVARASGGVVVGGMFERSDDPDRPYNTLVAVGADGAVRATYRKVHLYDSFGYRESDRLRAGDPVPVVMDVDGVRLGLLTCYDLRFPEHGRALADAGADAFVVPAAWNRGPLKEDHWQTLLRARAIENTVYVAAAAQIGRTYCGLSQLVDPFGVVVAALGEEEGRLAAELDPERIVAVRTRNPALQHRRSWPSP